MRTRLVCAAVLAACGSLLFVATRIEPNARGFGTHRQLGLPMCGFLLVSGVPCATCGMTTAFTHAVRGDLMAALATQPAGALFAVSVAALVLVSAYGLVFGLSLAPLWYNFWRLRPVLGGVAVVLVAWIYKIIVVTGTL